MPSKEEIEERDRRGHGGFETNVTVLGVLPKNSQYELHVRSKDFAPGHGARPSPFIEIREFWFRDGPMAEPKPTKSGTMIRREYFGKLLEILLGGLAPGDVTVDVGMNLIDKVVIVLGRQTGRPDDAILDVRRAVKKMIRGMTDDAA